MIRERDLSKWLEEATAYSAQRWGTERFVSGDCHVLAMALYLVSGRCGSLWACLRKEVDEEGNVFSTTYSHMVYSPPDDSSWDIDGAEADERWVGQFDNCEEPDEDGLVSEFDWVEVPCGHAEQADAQHWLELHYAQVDRQLLNAIVVELKALPGFVQLD